MFYRCTDKGAPHYKSTLLDNVPHGFSTRHGGVSTGEFTRSMNLAFKRGDDDETVRRNFEIFAETIGADPKCGIMLGQIHSSDVLTVTKSEFGLGIYKKSDICLDGYASNTKGALLCVRVADCVPVLLADTENNVISALHSGWRPSVKKISAVGVKKMCELGAFPDKIKVAIGPSICKDCYSVGKDFTDECENSLGKEMCREFISEKDGIYYADLKRLIYLTLVEAGIREENIDISEKCTCCEPEEFFSHRFHKNNRGTMCAMIALPT